MKLKNTGPRYGSLSDQIANIQDQYEGRIDDAKAAENKVLEAALIKERDKKIADIQKNFESDAHIEEKIRDIKAVGIDRYLNEIKRYEETDLPIAYEFKDIETGEIFSSGNVETPAAYKKRFNSSEGYFKAKSIPDDQGGFYVNTMAGHQSK